MLKTTAIIETVVIAIGGTEAAQAHDRGHHRANGHAKAAEVHYHPGHRRFERRAQRRADRRAYRRHWRTNRWVADHRRFLYDGRSIRHRHGRGGWHWHRAPRYRFHAVGHPCDHVGRHRHRGVWFYGLNDARRVGTIAYHLQPWDDDWDD